MIIRVSFHEVCSLMVFILYVWFYKGKSTSSQLIPLLQWSVKGSEWVQPKWRCLCSENTNAFGLLLTKRFLLRDRFYGTEENISVRWIEIFRSLFQSKWKWRNVSSQSVKSALVYLSARFLGLAFCELLCWLRIYCVLIFVCRVIHSLTQRQRAVWPLLVV